MEYLSKYGAKLWKRSIVGSSSLWGWRESGDFSEILYVESSWVAVFFKEVDCTTNTSLVRSFRESFSYLLR